MMPRRKQGHSREYSENKREDGASRIKVGSEKVNRRLQNTSRISVQKSNLNEEPSAKRGYLDNSVSPCQNEEEEEEESAGKQSNLQLAGVKTCCTTRMSVSEDSEDNGRRLKRKEDTLYMQNKRPCKNDQILLKVSQPDNMCSKEKKLHGTGIRDCHLKINKLLNVGSDTELEFQNTKSVSESQSENSKDNKFVATSTSKQINFNENQTEASNESTCANVMISDSFVTMLKTSSPKGYFSSSNETKTSNEALGTDISKFTLSCTNSSLDNVDILKSLTTVADSKLREINVCSAQMLGLSPAVMTTVHQGKQTEVIQHNYRLSTSVTASKMDKTHEKCSPNLSTELKDIVLKECATCPLPSSVYGMQASNIETVLSGLNVAADEEQNLLNVLGIPAFKFGGLKDVVSSEDECLRPSENENILLDQEDSSSKFSDSHLIENKEMRKNSMSLLPIENNPANQKDISSSKPSLTLKLNNLDLLSGGATDTSEDPPSNTNHSTMDQHISKSHRSPKITSPQILEQHISKIISENAAIVETLDPLWTRRYMRQSSVSSSQNIDSEVKKANASVKIRRFSEDMSPGYSPGYHSKLQYALLGKADGELHESVKQTCNINTAISLPSDTSLSSSCHGDNGNCSASESGLVHQINILPFSEKGDSLEGSTVKSLLCLKQGKSQKTSSVDHSVNAEKHPQNPEGSIIKDLLLKTRASKLHSLSPTSLEEIKVQNSLSLSNVQEVPLKKQKSDDLLSVVYMCTNCNIVFRNKENLEAHQNHYCKGSRSHTVPYRYAGLDDSSSITTFPYTTVDSTCKSSMLEANSPLTPVTKSCEVHKYSRNSYKELLNTEDKEMGQILKKQLMAPLAGAQSPPLKKRKISEPVLPTNRLEHIGFTPPIDEATSITANQNKFEISLSPHRCRSQSVHLFGGEVQILDGIETKKIKIDTGLRSTFSSMLTSLPVSSGKNLSLEAPDMPDCPPASVPTVVVTIAKPVLNAGGTMTQVHTPVPDRSLTPVVALSDHLMVTGIEEFSDLNSSSKVFSPESPSQSSITFSLLHEESSNKLNSKVEMASTSISDTDMVLPPISLGYTQPDSVSETSFKLDSPSLSLQSSSVSNKQMQNVILTQLSKSPSNSLILDQTFLQTSSNSICKDSDSAFQCVQVTNSSLTLLPSPKGQKDLSGQSTMPLSPSQSLIIPTVTLTPSSPVSLSPSNIDTTKNVSEDVLQSEPGKAKKFLAPTRPSSLPLKKKAFTLVGSTIVSPETPRPKKTCIQLYRDGHAYTYLGLKCSTRSTYCCIYRPQPMYVPQNTDSKLSMYSNWQVVPADQLFGLTPGQLMTYYDSRQVFHSSKPISVNAQLADPLLFTHSSYWVFRMQEKEKKKAQEKVIELRSTLPEAEPAAETIESTQETEAVDASFSTVLPSKVDISNEESSSNREQSSHSSPTENSQQNTHLDPESVSDAVEIEISNFFEEMLDDKPECVGDSATSHPPKRVRIFEGGFKSSEDYTYVRGRGRGKYVCEECGIRCKKPSMLKKHIRTHTDLRPYKCRHCSFAFKTKGNLTKHMKSKAHHKKCMELGIVPVPTTIDDSQIDEEALAKQVVLQEQLECKHQQFSDGEDADDDDDDEEDYDDSDGLDDEGEGESDSGGIPISQSSRVTEAHSSSSGPWGSTSDEDLGQFEDSPFDKELHPSQCQKIVEQEKEAAHSLLHLSTLNEPRWNNKSSESYKDDNVDIPVQPTKRDSSLDIHSVPASVISHTATSVTSTWSTVTSPRNITESSLSDSSHHSDQPLLGTPPVMWLPPEPVGHRPRSYSIDLPVGGNTRDQQSRLPSNMENVPHDNSEDVSKDVFEASQREHFGRRYSISVVREARRAARSLQTPTWSTSSMSDDCYPLTRWSELDSSEEPMDLTVSRGRLDGRTVEILPSFSLVSEQEEGINEAAAYSPQQYHVRKPTTVSSQSLQNYGSFRENNNCVVLMQDETHPCSSGVVPSITSYAYLESCGETQIRKDDYINEHPSPEQSDYRVCSPVTPPTPEESTHGFSQDSFPSHNLAVNDTCHEEPIVTSRAYAEFILPNPSANMEEGRCVCGICNKTFTKPSQLRLHVNIHYFERPFRCDNCAVSFRTKGHLQKHKRSVSHYNKVNMNMTFGTPTTDNPRPFKCADCKIAFRIHGHLAKHLRSKMHIMKLECLGKLPFGMYAEMERSGVSLNEIDTTDCNNSLESLQVMAQRLYQRDPRRMRWHSPEHPTTDPDNSKLLPPLTPHLVDGINSSSDQPVIPLGGSHVIGTDAASTSTGGINHNMIHRLSSGVKQEPSDLTDPYCTNSGFSDGEGPLSPPPPQYSHPQHKEVVSLEQSPRKSDTELDHSLSLHRSCTCHLCGRLFKSAKFLQVHLYCDHTGWSPPAEVTGQTHDSSVITSHSPSTQKQDLTCELCRRQFINQNTLQQHLLSHAQPRPFVCEICDAGFTSSILLVAHLATHQQVGATEHRRVDGHTDLVQTV